ncbi:MAG: DUF4350 domain-containing protein [Armatimonadota bacterium]|nr:DUF4350 domain-containing protein [bacterium]
MRRLSKDIWILVGLLFILVIAGMIAGNRRPGNSEIEYYPRRTTFSARPGGLKALYETLRRLDYPVQKRMDKLSANINDGTLFVISPEKSISREEWASLRGWVERGNLLVLAGFNPPEPVAVGHSPATSVAKPRYPSFMSSGVRSLRIAGPGRIDDTEMSFDKYSLRSTSSQSEADDTEDSETSKDTRKPIIPLFIDPDGVVVGYSHWGSGAVIILPDGWPISNAGIGRGDNLIIVLNALDHRSPDHKLPVIFDEYHHGYGETKGIMSLIDTPARLGLVQIAIAFLLLVFASSRRFGKPIPLMEGTRQRGEYLSSMASLLRKAKATDLVRKELGRRFLADIATTVGLVPNASVDAIIEAVDRRHPDKVETLRTLCNAAESYDQDNSEADILALARRWHKMRKELTR